MGAVGALIGVGATATAASVYSSVQAQKMSLDYQRSQLRLNQSIAEIKAADALSRGRRSAEELRGKTRRLIGSQRAALAAQGLNLEKGSAAAIQADTAALGAADEETIKNNAYREAFGYRVEALGFGNQSAFAGIFSNFSQRSTILTGGLNFAGQSLRDYYAYRNR